MLNVRFVYDYPPHGILTVCIIQTMMVLGEGVKLTKLQTCFTSLSCQSFRFIFCATVLTRFTIWLKILALTCPLFGGSLTFFIFWFLSAPSMVAIASQLKLKQIRSHKVYTTRKNKDKQNKFSQWSKSLLALKKIITLTKIVQLG